MKRVLFISVFMFVCSAVLLAQSEMFEWKLYSAFDNPKQVIETKEDIYILSDSYLYSYNKEYSELREINKDNMLSDTEISFIKYDYQSNMLVIIYTNSNIDIIHKSKTYNIPYIKNTAMTSSKVINNVNFVPSRNEIYLSTGFGIVIINSKKFEIKNSYELDSEILDATYFADKYYLIDKENNLKSCAEDNIPYLIDNWELIKTFGNRLLTLLPVNDNLWIQTYYEIAAYNPVSGKTKYVAYGDYGSSIMQNPLGEVYVHNKRNGALEIYISDYSLKETVVFSKSIGYTPKSISNNNNKSIYWMLNSSGIASYKLSDNNFVLNDTIPVIDQLAVSKPYSLTISGSTLYCIPVGLCIDNEAQNIPYANISYLKDYRWHNIIGEKVPSPKSQTDPATCFTLPSKLAIDPTNDEISYVGTYFDGLYKFKKTEYVENWNSSNTPSIEGVKNNYTNQLSCLTFDKNRNLWMTSYSPSKPLLIMKPDGKWVAYSHITPLIDQKFMSSMIHPKRSNTKWFVSNDYTSSFVLALNINGTLERTSDDKFRRFGEGDFKDQDGKTIDATTFFCIEEDMDGKLWIGTDRGPIILTRPDNFASTNFSCQRVKIARNDGTNNADLLLDDAIIRAIKVDGANCKWIGTSGDGAYLLSADGLETIHHFTTENSLLPSDIIYDIAINQQSGEVYFATDKGLVSYRAEASESQENYDNIYAFPNPVRPEYTGVVTITGLMYDSLVKITDTMGNLIYQNYSRGGQLIWNPITSGGQRVKSGVYYVWASSSDGKEGVVSKIVFIN